MGSAQRYAMEFALSKIPHSIAFSLITMVIVYIFLKIRKIKIEKKKFVFSFLFLSYLFLLYEIIFGISGGIELARYRFRPNLIPIASLMRADLDWAATQVVMNILLFLPFGALVPFIFTKMKSFPIVVIINFIICVIIEILQYYSGRSPDIDDVLFNLLGGMIGYALYKVIKRYNPSW